VEELLDVVVWVQSQIGIISAELTSKINHDLNGVSVLFSAGNGAVR
jgi:hypothetical protein